MPSVLEGIRVLDFSRIFSGPAATQILGDLGADVIKVEEPGHGDEVRSFGAVRHNVGERDGASPSFLAFNRNKRSVVLDLHCAAGRQAALQLAAKSDVIVHNFRPGAMWRWDLDYEIVRAINPRVIYCELTAFGATGPLSQLGANDLTLQAQCGLLSVTGEPKQPPVRCGTAAIDLHASLALASGVLAALLHRERTGEGQVVETSLLLSSAHLMSHLYAEHWMDGVERGPMGTANPLSVPNQVFPTLDGGVVIVASGDEMWRRCALALAPERLGGPEFRRHADRQRRRDELIAAMSAATRRMTSEQVLELLVAARVNVAKINSIGEGADHPQLAEAGGTVEFSFDGHPVRVVATPFHLSGAPARAERPPPRLGADTEAVLLEVGMSLDEIAALRRDGAFGEVRTDAEA